MERDGTGRIFIRPKFPALPPIFSLEFGEMIYQLRAALDGCIYQAAILETNRNPPPDEDYLEFPICATPKNFKNARRCIAPLPKDVRAFIKSIQPYNAPKIVPLNRALGILHDWARKDRHRYLHVLGSWASKVSPQLRLPNGVSLASMVVTGSAFLKDESEIARFTLNGYIPGMEIKANPNLAIDISVDEATPACAASDTFNLRTFNIFFFVEVIVGAFESFFSAKKVTKI